MLRSTARAALGRPVGWPSAPRGSDTINAPPPPRSWDIGTVLRAAAPWAESSAAEASGKVAGWKQVAAGTVGGTFQVAVGHPFNTIKAIVQTSDVGVAAATRKLLAQEGARGLYRGVGPPLVGIGAVTAVLFHANGAALQSIAGVQDPRFVDHLPLSTVAGCGALAGGLSVAVCTPVELVMIRLQTQDPLAKGAARGPLDCAKQIVRQSGMHGLYKGFTANLLRDLTQYFAYFMAYEAAKRAQVKEGQRTADLASWQLLAAGGMAGVAGQITQLPMDVVKTRMQSQSDAKPLYSGTMDCYRKTFAEGGIGGFYRGIGPVLLRAFPANAMTFFGFEMALQWLK